MADEEVVVGKLKFFQERSVTGLEGVEQQAATLQADGQTVMFVAINGKAAGILPVSDPVNCPLKCAFPRRTLTGC